MSDDLERTVINLIKSITKLIVVVAKQLEDDGRG